MSARTRLAVWTRCGGRCSLCNAFLLGDELSGSTRLNKALIAHIVAAAPDGPRGDPDRSPQLIDDPANLLLLCHAHHHLVDDDEPEAYPEDRLKQIKADHEDRVHALTGIHAERGTHALFYGARIGAHDALVREDLAWAALLPDRYPKDGRPITLGLGESALTDRAPAYWAAEVEHLRRQFEMRVRQRLASGEIHHLSVFAIAPQPLLIELGRQLCDIADVEVFQPSREPKGWAWRPAGPPIDFQAVEAPSGAARVVALKLAVSATVTDERVRAAVGPEAPLWSISAEAPGNDCLHRSQCLAEFRRRLRLAYDRIKAAHGEQAEIHVLPALPAAAAIEVGRVWMPKSDLPLVIYDNDRDLGGFVARHRIGA
ncbi:MAG: SAVED domain-containing protein [Caulobacterales bacterium]